MLLMEFPTSPSFCILDCSKVARWFNTSDSSKAAYPSLAPGGPTELQKRQIDKQTSPQPAYPSCHSLAIIPAILGPNTNAPISGKSSNRKYYVTIYHQPKSGVLDLREIQDKWLTEVPFLTYQSWLWPPVLTHKYPLQSHLGWHTLPPSLNPSSPWSGIPFPSLWCLCNRTHFKHAVSWALGSPLGLLPSLFLPSSLIPTKPCPHPTPSLMAQFSGDASRCLWLLSPPYLQ